jgi:hypothetical protein
VVHRRHEVLVPNAVHLADCLKTEVYRGMEEGAAQALNLPARHPRVLGAVRKTES